MAKGNGQSIRDRFTALMSHPFGRSEPVAAPPPKKPQVSVVELELADWASRRECRDVFIPFLEDLLVKADESVSANMQSHPLIAYALGVRDGQKSILRMFRKWSGTASSADESRS